MCRVVYGWSEIWVLSDLAHGTLGACLNGIVSMLDFRNNNRVACLVLCNDSKRYFIFALSNDFRLGGKLRGGNSAKLMAALHFSIQLVCAGSA